ncbi:MAG: T9SS type A sorting domain-containing protein [Cyclobacteriaceae bacterium]
MQLVLIVRPLILIALLAVSLATGTFASEIGDNPVDQDAAVYPNPAQDFVFLRVDRLPLSLPSDADISIKIVDILGNPMKVQSEQIDVSTYRIDLNQYPSGYYLLVVYCNSCSDTEKGLFKFLKQ